MLSVIKWPTTPIHPARIHFSWGYRRPWWPILCPSALLAGVCGSMAWLLSLTSGYQLASILSPTELCNTAQREKSKSKANVYNVYYSTFQGRNGPVETACSLLYPWFGALTLKCEWSVWTGDVTMMLLIDICDWHRVMAYLEFSLQVTLHHTSEMLSWYREGNKTAMLIIF